MEGGEYRARVDNVDEEEDEKLSPLSFVINVFALLSLPCYVFESIEDLRDLESRPKEVGGVITAIDFDTRCGNLRRSRPGWCRILVRDLTCRLQ